ncbi:carboxylate--amine ligase [Olsenella massiliensis]|uniref:carboxylate--amine ligase n=1 Tax=Olsenella massiliensis TaxID=1622075 RepID=UPI00071CFA9A|nr:hypothetical protein [Olsenella massiliensis]
MTTSYAEIVPVVIGGDIGAYALGREMHEAFGVTSVCVAPEPIGAIAHSAIFDCHQVSRLGRDEVARALTTLARDHAPRTVVVVSNVDHLIATLGRMASSLPANVVMAMPPADVVDLVSDKVEFARLCADHGLETPRSMTAPCAAGHAAPEWDGDFPLVLKPARSPEYAPFLARGFKKVYFVESQERLESILSSLTEAGFAGDMLVQELIGGDDTYMDSITLYIDQGGRCTHFGAAGVLLEDHAPSMLGNPVAMITRQMPGLWERCVRMLTSVGYRGFANFDVKRDPKRPGRAVFLEVNPRIGRNSYYNLAAGANPMEALVRDLVGHEAPEPQVAGRRILYTLVPVPLLRRYVRDPALKAEMEELVGAGKVFDPQRYAADRGVRRMLDVELTELNQWRKFARHYPEPTDTSF